MPFRTGMFRSISGFGGQGSIILDRFGTSYLAISATYSKGSPFEFGYFEGYVGTFRDHSKLSRDNLQRAISGPPFCVGANASLLVGIGGVRCLNFNAMEIYSSGFYLGISGNWNIITYPLGNN
jgi:hypothetical protein